MGCEPQSYPATIQQQQAIPVVLAPEGLGVQQCQALPVWVCNLEGGGGTGPTTADYLRDWGTHPHDYLVSMTYDVTYPDLIVSGAIAWPDGSPGTYTLVSSTNELWDAYTASHTDSGLVVTQSAVTRNAGDYVITRPAIVVA